MTVCLSRDSLEYRHVTTQRTEQRLISFNKDSLKIQTWHTVLSFLGLLSQHLNRAWKDKDKHRKNMYSLSWGVHQSEEVCKRKWWGKKGDEEALFPSPPALTAQPRLVLKTLDYMVYHKLLQVIPHTSVCIYITRPRLAEAHPALACSLWHQVHYTPEWELTERTQLLQKHTPPSRQLEDSDGGEPAIEKRQHYHLRNLRHTTAPQNKYC